MFSTLTTDHPTPASLRVSLGCDAAWLTGLALLALCLGLGVNRLRENPLPLRYASKAERLQAGIARLSVAPSKIDLAPAGSEPATVAAEPEMIDLARFHDLLENGTPVLDARPGLFYRVGHVPGARSLSRAEFEADYTRERVFLEAHRQETLVVYCAGEECVDSRMVAAALGKLGYQQVLIFAGGWDEWRQAGLPEERP